MSDRQLTDALRALATYPAPRPTSSPASRPEPAAAPASATP